MHVILLSLLLTGKDQQLTDTHTANQLLPSGFLFEKRGLKELIRS